MGGVPLWSLCFKEFIGKNSKKDIRVYVILLLDVPFCPRFRPKKIESNYKNLLKAPDSGSKKKKKPLYRWARGVFFKSHYCVSLHKLLHQLPVKSFWSSDGSRCFFLQRIECLAKIFLSRHHFLRSEERKKAKQVAEWKVIFVELQINIHTFCYCTMVDDFDGVGHLI